MKQRRYAYRVIRRGNMAEPRFMGTVTAQSMDEAAEKIVKQHNIVIRTTDPDSEPYTMSLDRRFMLNGEPVSVCVWADPDAIAAKGSKP